MNRNVQKTLRVFIFILLLLLIILVTIPGLLFHNYITTFSETSKSLIKNIAIQYKYIYIFLVIIVLTSLMFFRKFFHDDYKEVKKIADKKLYDESDLKSEIPPVVWLSIVGAVILMFLIGWIAVK